MKIYVATSARVGSTWVCNVLGALMDTEYVHMPSDRSVGDPLTKEDEELVFSYGQPLIKTHDYTPAELLAIDEGENVLAVSVRRNFFDTLLSQILYERNVRSKQDLPITPAYKTVFDRWPDAPDEAIVNLIIETQTTQVAAAALSWSKFNRLSVQARIVQVNYDKIARDTPALIEKFSHILKPTKEQIDKALEGGDFYNAEKRTTRIC